MTKEETTATWQSWLLDAIHKIRYQKQRPNVERISACIRMHHPQYSNEAVQEHIEMCVANKTITKVKKLNIKWRILQLNIQGIYSNNTYPTFCYSYQVCNKGLVSYRDPESAPGRGQKTLHVTNDMDLTKVSIFHICSDTYQ